MPRNPSDRWSMSPLRSTTVEAVVDRIRGKMRQATMFLATEEDGLDLLAAINAADGR